MLGRQLCSPEAANEAKINSRDVPACCVPGLRGPPAGLWQKFSLRTPHGVGDASLVHRARDGRRTGQLTGLDMLATQSLPSAEGSEAGRLRSPPVRMGILSGKSTQGSLQYRDLCKKPETREMTNISEMAGARSPSAIHPWRSNLLSQRFPRSPA